MLGNGRAISYSQEWPGGWPGHITHAPINAACPSFTKKNALLPCGKAIGLGVSVELLDMYILILLVDNR